MVAASHPRPSEGPGGVLRFLSFRTTTSVVLNARAAHEVYVGKQAREVRQLVRGTQLQAAVPEFEPRAAGSRALLFTPHLGSEGCLGWSLSPAKGGPGASVTEVKGWRGWSCVFWGPKSWPRGPSPAQPPPSQQVRHVTSMPPRPPGTAGVAGRQSHCLLTHSLSPKPQGHLACRAC